MNPIEYPNTVVTPTTAVNKDYGVCGRKAIFQSVTAHISVAEISVSMNTWKTQWTMHSATQRTRRLQPANSKAESVTTAHIESYCPRNFFATYYSTKTCQIINILILSRWIICISFGTEHSVPQICLKGKTLSASFSNIIIWSTLQTKNKSNGYFSNVIT